MMASMRAFYRGDPFSVVSKKYENLCYDISQRCYVGDECRVRLRDLARAIRGEIGPEDVEILTRREG